LPDGRLVMLKIFTPYGYEDEWNGARLLQWYQGKGAVKVLALENGALLMEHLGGGDLMELCDRGRSDEAALIAASLVGQARTQDRPPPELKIIDQRFEFLFTFSKHDIPEGHREIYLKAVQLAKKMLAKPAPHVPLHGDLHFRNVLSDGKTWRLIDPKGLIGPPAYDLANLFINPWDRPDIVLAEHRPERLARLLGRHTGHEPADLISWAIAHAAIAATWNISNGGTGRHPLTALGHLFRAQTKL